MEVLESNPATLKGAYFMTKQQSCGGQLGREHYPTVGLMGRLPGGGCTLGGRVWRALYLEEVAGAEAEVWQRTRRMLT